ncbi:hypothetical protein L195_g055258 [Trifolium pratense]|uniref:RNase H type-1 domain-containing protein n=1 Tax=Trifolium pratense TaxID=57577 RepID=A0A2K3KKB6_TRIPR|nr:hypothetical protein L195_g055258 [Trifolium pratense]
MLPTNNKEGVELISSICYHIWNAINCLVFQDKDIPVLVVVDHACANLNEYKLQREKKLRTIIIEMDSKVVVQAIQRKEYPKVYWGRIARTGENMLEKLPNVSVMV